MAKVAIMGFGTVGSGVGEVLTTNADTIAFRAGEPVELKYILDLRDFPGSPFENLLVKDFSIIENDPEVTVIAECMGGVGAAKMFTERALRAGKSVVTSNKELVAKFGDELFEIAREKNVNYLYEASVGGGIPLLRPLGICLAANKITELYGILNGTTNYILTKMVTEGTSFDTALKEAQAKGYAEADPTADIEGHDACRKVAIMASLISGRHIHPDSIPTSGISGITLDDVELAAAAGRKIKLLGRIAAAENGNYAAYVSPHLIAQDALLANVNDVFNGVVVHGNAVGEVMFYGPGAGKLPTASAVTADLIDAVKHQKRRKQLDWLPGGTLEDYKQLQMQWYVRGQEIPEQLLKSGSLITSEHTEQKAVITEAMTRNHLDEICAGIDALSVIPVLS